LGCSCNPTSNLVYPFERNLTTSETLVEELKYSIEKNTNGVLSSREE